MQQVFISYSRLDESPARKLYDSLSKQGFSPWLDKVSLLPGQTWENEIKTAIQKSNFVILLLSKNSLDRQGYFHKEIRLALDALETIPSGKIFLIPARLDSCDVPTFLQAIQWVDLFSDWDDGFKKIRDALLYQRTQEILSKSIEELSPLPNDIKIISPDRDLPSNIIALSGHWAGRWGCILPSQLVVEKIEENSATIVYSWGEHLSGKFRKGWNREEAKISSSGTIEFGDDVQFTFKIDNSGNVLYGMRGKSQDADRITMKRSKASDANQDKTYELLGSFLAIWVELEKTITELVNKNRDKLPKLPAPAWADKIPAWAIQNSTYGVSILTQLNMIDSKTAETIDELRSVRNQLVHGKTDFRKDLSPEIYQRLKQ